MPRCCRRTRCAARHAAAAGSTVAGRDRRRRAPEHAADGRHHHRSDREQSALIGLVEVHRYEAIVLRELGRDDDSEQAIKLAEPTSPSAADAPADL